jgi:ligand-binding sensor domain-containing protein
VPWGQIKGAVWTVYHDHTDGWWFGTRDALYYYRGARLERFDAAAGLPPGGVTSILESRNGQLWVGTDGGGIARLVNRRFERFAAQDGLSDDAVTFLLEDREGSLWVGTRHGGLNRFRQPVFTLYTPREGLSARVVWSVYGDREGALWIGTELGGLDRLQRGRFTNYMPGKSVVATLQTRDGILWAATREGLARLRRGHWDRVTFPGTHPTVSVSALTEDRTGALWLGGDDGLYRWKGGALRDYTERAGLGHAKVRTIVEDGDGVLWIGTHGRGLLRLQDDHFTALTMKEGLSNDVVESLFADEHGLWVGTESGLNLVRNGRTRDEFFAMRLPDLQQLSQGAALVEWIRAAGDGWRGTSIWHHCKKDGTAMEVEVAARAFTYAGRPAALIVAADTPRAATWKTGCDRRTRWKPSVSWRAGSRTT